MEQTSGAGRTFPSEQTVNSVPETEAAQLVSATSPRQIGGEGTVSGEYSFQDRPVRTLTVQGEIWFVATDVCAVLEHSDPSKAISRLEDDEKGATIVRTLGGPQTLTVINESGLYALVMTSRKPQARAFRRWVTSEVLPAIRKTGFYSRDGAQVLSEGAIVIPAPDRPTRFVVMAAPGRAPHIRQTDVAEALTEFKSLDLQCLCYALKTIEAWWEKAQIKASLRPDHDGGFAISQLHRAIANGALTADQYLGRQEDA
jgi:hypothetical protein